MAAIKLKDGLDITPDLLSKMYARCAHDLPAYARPIFLRFQEDFIVTQTMKHRKVELVSDGFDPRKIKDPLYVVDTNMKTYIPLTVDTWDGVLSSKL